jgi:signal transduction histidine kinase
LRWFSARFVPIKNADGSVTSVMGIARDIDQRKKLELQLKRLTRELEKRVSERTVELVESQKHLQTLARQIVNAQEEERRRVSRELHDEAGQALISLKLSLAATLEELPLPFPKMYERLQAAITQVDQTMNQVRTLAHSLRPPVLDVAGINLSLEEYCSEFSQRTHIPVEYRGIDLFAVPEETSISLFRFLQEALTNVAKHARANAVQVGLEYEDHHIRLTVHDNGQGFTVDKVPPGIGLAGMQERLALLRGSLQVISNPGQGTQLIAEIPWTAPAEK